jgi:hypothetical protein
MRNVTKQKRKRRLTLSINNKGLVQGRHNYSTMDKMISTLKRMIAINFEQNGNK